MRTLLMTGAVLCCGVIAFGQDAGGGVQDAPLSKLVEDCQKQTKKRFIYDDQVNGMLTQKKIHLILPQMPKSNDEFFAIFQSVLEVNQLALIPVGKPEEQIYKIVQGGPQGGKKPARVLKEPTEPNDSFVTRIFRLTYVQPRDVSSAINQLTGVQPVVIDSAGVLVVTDYDYNIKRIEEIVTTMDVKRPDIDFKVVRLENALAEDVEKTINDLISTLSQRGVRAPQPAGGVPGQYGQQEQAKVKADKRTNSLIVLAEPVRMEQILDAIQKLDQKAPFETSGIYIVHLRHTNAIDIARTLNALYKISTDDKGVPAGQSTVKPGQAVAPGISGEAPGAGRSSSPAAPLTGAEPTIVADTRSNSIILITDRNTSQTLQDLIKRLDQRRPQVLIKSTVVEVTADDTFDLGVELGRAVDPENHITTFIHSDFGNSTIVPSSDGKSYDIVPKETAGLILALVHDRIGNVGALLRAIKSDATVRILDEPEAATVDNGSASITVQSAVPKLQTTVTGTGISQTSFNGYETAETIMTISPHISEGSYLRLDTEVKIEKFGSATRVDIPPTKTARNIKTTVLVPNGRTVVIGGIVTQDSRETITKVPLLGDIPILGFFFRRTKEESAKRTLYIFITPYILYDDTFADFKELTRDRKIAVEGLRSEALKNLSLEGRGDPVPISRFRYVRPPEVTVEEK